MTLAPKQEMEAVQMLKRFLCVSSLVGLMSTAAVAGTADFELLWNGGSGQGDAPLVLQPGVPTPLNVSIKNNTGAALPVGGVSFEFAAPGGGVSFDYDGPDNVSNPNDRPSLVDDGWQWGGTPGAARNTDGTPGPVYPLFAGGVFDFMNLGILFSRPYTFINSPPQTAYLLDSDGQGVVVPANGTMELGTLLITAGLPGPGGSDVALNSGAIVNRGVAAGFAAVEGLGNTSASLTIVPEPATLALLAAGGLVGLRRRRQS